MKHPAEVARENIKPTMVIQCNDPAVAGLVRLINDLSDKGRKQAGAILQVIHRFDKGQG